jgi:hypothetical protein
MKNFLPFLPSSFMRRRYDKRKKKRVHFISPYFSTIRKSDRSVSDRDKCNEELLMGQNEAYIKKFISL